MIIPTRGGRPTVVGICGSRRDGSVTRRALEDVLAAAAAVGATTELLDLAELALPVFDPDGEPGAEASRLTRTIRRADALVIGTPTYHGSFSGVLKNALDYCGFEEFEDTTVALLAVSGGPFPTTALDHLRIVCRSLNAWVLPHEAAIPHARRVYEDDTLASADLRDRIRTLGERTVEYAAIVPGPPATAPCQEV